jgi:hypothetical protein
VLADRNSRGQSWLLGREGGEGVYVPRWTRDTGTSPVNTGFFERQPGTKPGTTCVRPGQNVREGVKRVELIRLNESYAFPS